MPKNIELESGFSEFYGSAATVICGAQNIKVSDDVLAKYTTFWGVTFCAPVPATEDGRVVGYARKLSGSRDVVINLF